MTVNSGIRNEIKLPSWDIFSTCVERRWDGRCGRGDSGGGSGGGGSNLSKVTGKCSHSILFIELLSPEEGRHAETSTKIVKS